MQTGIVEYVEAVELLVEAPVIFVEDEYDPIFTAEYLEHVVVRDKELRQETACE